MRVGCKGWFGLGKLNLNYVFRISKVLSRLRSNQIPKSSTFPTRMIDGHDNSSTSQLVARLN